MSFANVIRMIRDDDGVEYRGGLWSVVRFFRLNHETYTYDGFFFKFVNLKPNLFTFAIRQIYFVIETVP